MLVRRRRLSRFWILKIFFFVLHLFPIQHGKVADWLYKCEKTLDFFFDNQPDDITEEAVAQAEHEEV